MEFIDLKQQYKELKSKIDENIQAVLNKGSYINGKEVDELATALANYCGAKYCLPCGNGTDALTIALKCINVSEKDAIFLPSFTFFATAEVVALEKAKPIFIDVNAKTFNIDCDKLENAIINVIKDGKYNPKAIISVDLFGLPADYLKLREIANKYHLLIIEDAAQGFGGSINGKKTCSFGDISTTSFFPAKPLGCYGDGGAIFTDNKEYYDMIKSLAVHGKGSDKYDNVRIGYNSRLDTIQAAILLPKLAAFKSYELENRQIIAMRYTQALKHLYKTPYIPIGYESSWAQYTLILKNELDRQRLQTYLSDKGIPSMVYYPIPMHKQTAFVGYNFNLSELTISEKLCKTVLSIPMHPYLDESSQEYIIDALVSFKRG